MSIHPFMQAIWDGDLNAVERMLATGADPDLHSHGHSALEIAIEADQPEILGCLIGAGANVFERRSDGWTLLHGAVNMECEARNQCFIPADLRLIQPVLDAGLDPAAEFGPQRLTPLDIALQYRHNPAAKVLRDAGGPSL